VLGSSRQHGAPCLHSETDPLGLTAALAPVPWVGGWLPAAAPSQELIPDLEHLQKKGNHKNMNPTDRVK